MGILEEVRAAEEKSAAMKEEAKQKAAEQIRLSQAQAETGRGNYRSIPPEGGGDCL